MMTTRRAILTQGPAAAALAIVPGFLQRALGEAAAQSQLSAQHAADEMTVNSAPQPEHYPSPDFGSPPAEIPPEAKAVSGVDSLKGHASRRGLVVGGAVVVHGLETDSALQELVAEQYGILVPEGELKWRALRPTADDYDFRGSDALFAFAAKHHMLVRGHTLLWHNSVPDWLHEGAAHRDVRQLAI